MFYHLILTDDCNLCCSYCRAKTFEDADDNGREVKLDYSMPSQLSFDLKLLYRFLENDKDAVLTFYGGEPLLRIDLIRKIMSEAPCKRFMVQTNGILLDKLGKEYVNRFETILVSLDGDEKITDLHRGKGTFRKVMDNVKKIKSEGFKGELIARMTVDEKTDIYKAVKFLSENKEFPFSSIHWQMDANFWCDYKKRKLAFKKWVKVYNKGIAKLVKLWIKKMKEGVVLKWYPFLDTAEDMLLERKSLLRCGSGYANFTILTDGNISPCPIMIGMKDYYLGNISETRPDEIKKIFVDEECSSCNLYDFCGGRCLYSNIIKPWPKEGRKLVCGTVRNLKKELERALPEIRKLLREGRIKIEDFRHTKYNGAEIIP